MEQRYSSTHSRCRQKIDVNNRPHTSAGCPSLKKDGTHCVEGWVGPRAGKDGLEKANGDMLRTFV